MADLLRPPPRPGFRDRVAGALAFISPARVATVAGALLLVAVACWWLLRSPAPPVEQQLPSARATTPAAASGGVGTTIFTPTATAAPSTTAAPALVVQAAGAVSNPGVYRLAAGARVIDLLDAAGGPTPDADSQAVTLAAQLHDGQRLYVPRVGEVVPPQPAASPSVPAAGRDPPVPDAPINLNHATPAQLEVLPGVGPATAAAIVDHRNRHGPFLAVDDLLEVRGIGPAKLDGFRDQVTI